MAILLFAIACPCSLHGQSLAPLTALEPDDQPPSDSYFENGFGLTSAIGDPWIVVGAPFDREIEYEAGAAYVFRRAGTKWIQQQKLFGDALFSGGFGASMAITGDWLIVGQPGIAITIGTVGGGRVFIFRRDQQGTPDELEDDRFELAHVPDHSTPKDGCRFGASLAFDGEFLLVGNGCDEFHAGKGHLFRRNGDSWEGPATLVPEDGRIGDTFGAPVSISQGTAVVGAREADGAAAGSGAAYVFSFEFPAWHEVAKLTQPAGGLADGFARSVSIDQDWIAVGAPSTDGMGFNSGAAYLFQHVENQWISWQTLTPTTIGNDLGFGASVAMVNGSLLVRFGQLANQGGALFTEDFGSWALAQTLQGAVGASRIALGHPLALIGRYVYAVGPSYDLTDFAELQNCVSPVLSGDCSKFDIAMNAQVDIDDLALFLFTLRGP